MEGRADRAVVAVVQMGPVYLDMAATVAKAVRFVDQAGNAGASLVVLPEAVFSGYPNWVNLHNPFTATYDAAYWQRYAAAAVRADSPVFAPLRDVVRRHRLTLVAGFVERDPLHDSVLYNSSLVYSPAGELLGVHRKVALVRQERLFFAGGGRRDLRTFDSPTGRLGIGICAEHYHPLMRYAWASAGVEVHCGLWINTRPFQEAVDTISRSLAIETGAFVLVACQVTPSGAPPGCELHFVGGSGIVSPVGGYLAGPLYDQEGVLVAEIRHADRHEASTLFQLVGRERREDLFSFSLAGE